MLSEKKKKGKNNALILGMGKNKIKLTDELDRSLHALANGLCGGQKSQMALI